MRLGGAATSDRIAAQAMDAAATHAHARRVRRSDPSFILGEKAQNACSWLTWAGAARSCGSGNVARSCQ